MKKALCIMLLGLLVLLLSSCWVKKDELDVAIDTRFKFLIAEALDEVNADYASVKKALESDYIQKSDQLATTTLDMLATLEEVKASAQQSSQASSAFIQKYSMQINQHITACDTKIPKTIEKEVDDHLVEISRTNAETLLKLHNAYYESIIDVLTAYAIEDADEQKAQEIKTIYDDYVALKQDFYGYLNSTKSLEDIQAGADALKVENVKTLIAQVTMESIRNTNILSRIENLDSALTPVQRSKLPKETAKELDALVTVWKTIRAIDELATKSNDDYALFTSIQANYAELDEHHRSMVYNFDIQQLYAQYFFLDFTPVNGGLSVKARAGYADKLVGDLSIPATYNGQKVVQIPDNAFKNCSKIASLVVPDTVNSIGFAAFNGCSGLKIISLPFVGKYRSGGNYAEGLYGYVFGTDSYFGGTKVDFGTFDDKNYKNGYKPEQKYHQYYIPIHLTSVIITNASSFNYHAFFNCSMIQDLTLNQEVIILGEGSFANCSSLATLALPYAESIPTAAFEGCTSLTQFTINEYVSSIGDYAFKGCKNLMRMNSEDDGEFVIPKNVFYIGYEAFNGVANMKSLTIPHIGKQRNGGNYGERLFGAIFGAAPYFGGVKVDFGTFDDKNYKNGYKPEQQVHLYYIPTHLRDVTVTNDAMVSYHAFNNCSMIANLRINKEASVDVHPEAFLGSVNPTYF